MLTAAGGRGDLTFFTWVPGSTSSSVGEAYSEIGRVLAGRRAVLLQERIYGDISSARSSLEARQEALAQIDPLSTPPTYVEGAPCGATGLAGLHAIAVQHATPEDVRPIEAAGHILGRVVRGHDAEYLALSDVGRSIQTGLSGSGQEETARVLETARRLVEEAGWTYQDVRRTWFYLRDILDWYDEFNRARNEFFEAVGLRRGAGSIIPASTGIEGRSPRDNWCTLDVLAARPLPGRTFSVRRLTHSKQNEAPQYGSAFSRGLEIALERCRYVFVSGTASIGSNGDSLHHGDFELQMGKTLENVTAVLAAAGAQPSHLCQATAFLKRAEDAACYETSGRRAGWSQIPAVRTRADVCRDELLFELDGTAIVEEGN